MMAAESFVFGFVNDDIEYDSNDKDSAMHDTEEEMPAVHDKAQGSGNKPRLHQLEDLVS